jgi:tRNA(Ile)-lysidine synthase
MDWPAQAVRLAKALPLERLHPAAVAELERCTRRVGVACSGGADSVCLLLLLYAHFPVLRRRLLVLHFDHGLRGEESTGDARFVGEVARALGLEFHCEDWDPPADPSEETAREARHGFLRRSLRCDGLLCFGHNADDVAETLLMRLGRGSGLDGLAGPRPVQRFEVHPGLLHLRPLLGLRGGGIRDSLGALGVPWCEDSTNATARYTRHRLRHEVLPLLSDIVGRDWVAGAGRARERVDEADVLLCEHAHLVLPGPGEGLRVGRLRSGHRAVARRALELWLARLDLRQGLSAHALDGLLDALCAGRAARVPAGGGVLVLTSDELRYTGVEPAAPEWPPVALVPGCELHLPGGAWLAAERCTFDPADVPDVFRDPAHHVACIRAGPGAVLTVRRWRDGDAYRPLGAPGRQLLSDQFINRKIPRAERTRLPVVCVDAVPVWCPGLASADDFRVLQETQGAVRLTYHPI